MDKLKLRWKIFLLLLGFCSLLLTILWVLQTWLLQPTYAFVRKGELEQAIQYTNKNLDTKTLEEIAFFLDSHYGVVIIDPDANKALGNSITQPYHRRTMEPNPRTISMEYTFTLIDQTEKTYVFYAFITPVETTISTLQLQLYFVTFTMICFSIFLSFFMAKLISKPIVQINENAKQLACGNYDTQFSGHGFLEITELSHTLNVTAKELGKTEHLRRELLANISHDLRTPLALIYSYSEMMHDFPDEISTEQTQIIMEETARLSSLVSDILDVSKLESGNATLTIEHHNLTQALSDTINRMSELVKTQGFQLDFIYQEDVYMDIDLLKVSQAFYNLLLNAINYSEHEKKITIQQIIKDDYVQIQVTDTGSGIDPEDLPYIWDRYYKVDKVHKRGIIGTGLGLSIVKKIIAYHNGTYGVESKVGIGSTFWFTLPYNKMDEV